MKINNKIIVNADDFGYSLSINEAIRLCFSAGYISKTTVMANMPAFEDAFNIAKANNFLLNVGLHLNLFEGTPLTEQMKNNTSFCDKNGIFHTGFHHSYKRLYLSKKDRVCAGIEIEAQILKYLQIGFLPNHIDSHHHIHTNLALVFTIIDLAKKYNFKSMRTIRNLLSSNERFMHAKLLYKKVINRFIRRSFVTTDWMGSYPDFSNNYQGKGTVEIMVHPIIKHEELIDEEYNAGVAYDYKFSDFKIYN